MRLLYFAPRPCWPLTTGARLRDYHLARQLAARCEVTLTCLRDPGLPEEPPPPADAGLADYVQLPREAGYTPSKIVRGLLGPLPVTVLNYSSAVAAAGLTRLLARGRFDTVQLESVHLLNYLPAIAAAPGPPRVLADWHNIESELMRRYSETSAGSARRIVARRTARLIERAEQRLLESCDAHTVVSDRECRLLKARYPDAEVCVVPNGVDVAFFAPAEAAAPERHGLLFAASMDYHANVDAAVWFVRHVWPELRRRHTGLRFTIAGRDPAAAVQALACDDVRVTGTVDDMRPYYAAAAVAVVPLLVGGGTRLKILEAMAAGVPVVSTRRGAEGLELQAGKHLLLADTPGEMVAAIERLLVSNELSRSLAVAARALVSAHYDWSSVGEALYRIHVGLRGRARRRGSL